MDCMADQRDRDDLNCDNTTFIAWQADSAAAIRLYRAFFTVFKKIPVTERKFVPVYTKTLMSLKIIR
jgi:hypothetical protein